MRRTLRFLPLPRAVSSRSDRQAGGKHEPPGKHGQATAVGCQIRPGVQPMLGDVSLQLSHRVPPPNGAEHALGPGLPAGLSNHARGMADGHPPTAARLRSRFGQSSSAHRARGGRARARERCAACCWAARVPAASRAVHAEPWPPAPPREETRPSMGESISFPYQYPGLRQAPPSRYRGPIWHGGPRYATSGVRVLTCAGPASLSRNDPATSGGRLSRTAICRTMGAVMPPSLRVARCFHSLAARPMIAPAAVSTPPWTADWSIAHPRPPTHVRHPAVSKRTPPAPPTALVPAPERASRHPAAAEGPDSLQPAP